MRSTMLPTIAICSAIGLALAVSAYAGKSEQHRPSQQPTRTIIAFHSMYGVDGPFVGDGNPVRGIPGDESPWAIERAFGTLDSAGHLLIVVRGLVFKDNPDPALIGKNDEPTFRGLVSCLTEQGNSVAEANVMTAGFPATETGDSIIHTTVALPNPCVAPIIMVLAGSENKWFSMTGFESEAGN